MKYRLLNETTEDYINQCRKNVLDQREINKDFKLAFYNHRDRSGCAELQGTEECLTCNAFHNVLTANDYQLDEYNERYQKAVKGDE